MVAVNLIPIVAVGKSSVLLPPLIRIAVPTFVVKVVDSVVAVVVVIVKVVAVWSWRWSSLRCRCCSAILIDTLSRDPGGCFSCHVTVTCDSR